MVFFHPALRQDHTTSQHRRPLKLQADLEPQQYLILERLFLAGLQPHLINSPHYNPLQSALRTGNSTETVLLTLPTKLGCRMIGGP